MAMKYWRKPKTRPDLVSVLSSDCALPTFVTEILVNRGLEHHSQLMAFSEQSLELESPFDLRDMQVAVELIQEAVHAQTPIVVYGDYDCDGVTSTTMLYSYLTMIGASVSYYIPDRVDEGYGMHQDAIQTLAEQGTGMIITVDNGISAVEEIALANSLGVQVIVTDHHQPGQVLPEAAALVNPHRRDCNSTYKKLAGVGVAFKLIVAMEEGDVQSVFEQYGDLLTLGTVGDLVGLEGENRHIVANGLAQMNQQGVLPGIEALCTVAGCDPATLTSQQLAFNLIPRINAAGRMGDAKLAVQLLLSEDPEETAALAERLQQLNLERRAVEEAIMADIEAKIQADPTLLYDRVLTFYGEGWHHGVIGIVSSRILERYGKPNLLMALEDGVLTGSGRSVEFFPLYRALEHCRAHLTRYGGHTQAAGFSLPVENFAGFKATLEEFAASNFWMMPHYDYVIDKIIKPQELTMENIEALSALEPFGSENQQPLFLFEDVKLLGISPVSENKHLRLKLQFGSTTMTAMYFRMSTEQFVYPVGSRIDFLATVQINQYNNRTYLSVILRDVHQHGFDQRSYFTAKSYYEMLKRNEPVAKEIVAKLLPSREDIAVLYRHLKQHGGHVGDLDLLFLTMLAKRVNYAKFRLMLDVLSEAGLVSVANTLDRVTLSDYEGKADLQKTKTMETLQSLAGGTTV